MLDHKYCMGEVFLRYVGKDDVPMNFCVEIACYIHQLGNNMVFQLCVSKNDKEMLIDREISNFRVKDKMS